DAVSEHDNPVEREPGLRTVPGDELANRVVVGALAAGGRESVEHGGLGVFEVGGGKYTLGWSVPAEFRFRHPQRPPLPSPTASSAGPPCGVDRSPSGPGLTGLVSWGEHPALRNCSGLQCCASEVG